MKLLYSITIAVIIAIAINVAPAMASTPMDVTILSDMSAWPYGTFQASGPAVDAGLICPSGRLTDISGSTAGKQNPNLILFVHKHFVCDDGSGMFEMDLNVRIAESGFTVRWLIVAGDGSYLNLSGEGDIQTAVINGTIYDIYSGKLLSEASIPMAGDIKIFSDMSAWPNGTFTASGSAVETGIICPTGMVFDDSVSSSGGQSPVLLLFVHKHFTCDDGSGSFEMDLNVRIADSGTTAQWRIVSGFGSLEGLSGEGYLTATLTENALYDTYFGRINIH